MRRLLVNDAMNQLGEHTFWNDLQGWFGMEFVGGPFERLEEAVGLNIRENYPTSTALVIRNASYFPPLKCSEMVPTISLLQDIFTEGPMREMQMKVIESSRAIVFNSDFTAHQYEVPGETLLRCHIIPLPVDFSTFEPGNPMGLQQALSLPDGCVCWIGASQGAAGHVKGFDIFLQVVRQNPDIPFVAVFKDAIPDSFPPNLKCYARLRHIELVPVIGACRVGLCTSRSETQHLAGIEMGACGLPMVAPKVGVYWNDKDIPGLTVGETTAAVLSQGVRACSGRYWDAEEVRGYWMKDFAPEVVRKQWTKLVEEVEYSKEDPWKTMTIGGGD